MLRSITAALFVLALGFTVVLGEETKGKVKAVTADTKTLVLVVDDKDKTFVVPADAKIYTTGKVKKKTKIAPEILVEGGLSGVKVDSTVTVTTETREVGEKKEKQEVVTAVKVEPAGKKKKKNQ